MTPNLNRHLSFPFRIGTDGRAAQVSSLEEHVRDEVIQLILTNPGERLFLPEFGGGLKLFVFSNVDDSTLARAKTVLVQNLSAWLGDRIILTDLQFNAEMETLEVKLSYRVIGSDESRTINFQRKGEG